MKIKIMSFSLFLLQDVAILILANKQDIASAASVTEIAEKLELHKIRNHKFGKSTQNITLIR